MTYDVEIMLRGNEKVYTETVHHIGNAVDDWTVEDASTMMHSVLKAIDHVLNPDRADVATTTMRGVNWIVSPFEDQAVVALEIHSASAVAGPFRIDRGRLESLLTDAVKTPIASSGVVH
jgi:hypothetical protein